MFKVLVKSVYRIYCSITKEDIEAHNIDREAVNYVDNSNNMVAGDTLADIQSNLSKFIKLIRVTRLSKRASRKGWDRPFSDSGP